MSAALRENAADVKQASTAAEALAVALSWLPEMILVDVRLGDANGIEVTRQIRLGWPQKVPQPRIVMLSAERRYARQQPDGADGFLAKPVALPDLLQAVALSARPAVGKDREDPLPWLQELFRSELSARLGSLDTCLATGDLPGARAILHQLIASSGLCLQRRLERDLRALYRTCGKRPLAAEVAREYFSLLVSTREFLWPCAAGNRD